MNYQSEKSVTARKRSMQINVHKFIQIEASLADIELEAITRTKNAMRGRDTVLTHSRCSENMINELMENNE